MDIIGLVVEQIKASHKKVKVLSMGVDYKDWHKIPDGVGTNVAWQIGHLIISKPFQLVIAPIERTKEIHEIIPFGDYLKRYGIGTKPATREREEPKPETLLSDFDKIQAYCLSRLENFDIKTLNEPTTVPHPIAKSKYDSLMWSFQHEIWHCGQLSLLRRAFGNPLKLG